MNKLEWRKKARSAWFTNPGLGAAADLRLIQRDGLVRLGREGHLVLHGIVGRLDLALAPGAAVLGGHRRADWKRA